VDKILHFEPSDDAMSSGWMTWDRATVAKPSNYPFSSENLTMEGVLARGSELYLFTEGLGKSGSVGVVAGVRSSKTSVTERQRLGRAGFVSRPRTSGEVSRPAEAGCRRESG